MKIKNIIIVIAVLPQLLFVYAKSDSSVDVISDSKLISMLDTSNETLKLISDEYNKGNKEQALEKLAVYFKNKMANSYFFSWKNFEERFQYYIENYPENINHHKRRKDEHLSLFAARTVWELPLTGLNGEEISAYKLRHLARSHKMIDIGFSYYLESQNIKYINYFVDQVRSLKNAYVNDSYEKEGNDVFEYYRSGYRVFNWLLTHNLFLASSDYTSKDQILLIKTFLYHGADLYDKTKKYNDGNHHTKGLMALSLISILFSEFQDSNLWFDHSINFLTKHLRQEINDDGFQFERSVHYHIGDIDNYFYVYYLAKLNQIKISKEFEQRFKSMFDALIKIALPNGKLPVLQDDTDEPWAELNQMHSPMFIGTLLFHDPEYKYFSNDNPSSGKYWFLRNEDIDAVKNVEKNIPQLKSIELKETGYYAMRRGWDKKDPFMIITAGLSENKPDHQHGDMLGLYGYANDNVILPNYQVRYFLQDYNFFKNSFVKNVALIDSIPLGQNWKGNRGGSGFGKFKNLPAPKTILWLTEKDFDVYIGTHDAYSNLGVDYFRKVIFVKDGFWIVNDEFLSDDSHNYQQVWQGHYSEEKNNHLRTTFSNGSGLDIIELNDDKFNYEYDSFRGKGNIVVSKKAEGNFEFNTLIYPFAHFEERAIVDDKIILPSTDSWSLYKNKFENDKILISADHIISNDHLYTVFGLSSIEQSSFRAITNGRPDIILKLKNEQLEIISINNSIVNFEFSQEHELVVQDHEINTATVSLNAGENFKVMKGIKK